MIYSPGALLEMWKCVGDKVWMYFSSLSLSSLALFVGCEQQIADFSHNQLQVPENKKKDQALTLCADIHPWNTQNRKSQCHKGSIKIQIHNAVMICMRHRLQAVMECNHRKYI